MAEIVINIIFTSAGAQAKLGKRYFKQTRAMATVAILSRESSLLRLSSIELMRHSWSEHLVTWWYVF